MNNKDWIFSGIGVFALSCVVLLIRTVACRHKRCHSPVKRSTGSRLEFIPERRSLRIRFARRSDLSGIDKLAESVFGRENCLGVPLLKKCLATLPRACRIAECRPDPYSQKARWNLCGYYFVLAMTNSICDLLKSGRLQDCHIPASSLRDYGASDVTSLYVMDLVVSRELCPQRECSGVTGSALLRDLVWFLQRLLQENGNVQELFTIVASPAGKQLVRKAGFLRDKNFRNALGWELWILSRHRISESHCWEKLLVFPSFNRFREDYVL